nr:MAG TPA: hypothetical protein [Caudoviricetes sp.]
MDTRSITLRLPVEMIEYVSTEEGINKGMINALENLMLIQNISMQEIKGLLSPGEWKMLADSLNGTMVTDILRVSKDALIAHNEDSDLYESTGKKWDVDIKALNAKISRLSGAQIDAIYRRVEKYWKNPGTDIEKWAKY